MQGVIHGDHYVYLYATMLHTESPILKEIYCESHRLEPWAVAGWRARVGRYVFPNVLYVEAEVRKNLLGRIPDLLAGQPEYADSVARRFEACGRQLGRRLHAFHHRGDRGRANVAGLLEDTGRVLSCGIFKEVFEHEQAMAFLARHMPVEPLRDRVLALYQPLCVPHFLAYEMKLLFYCAQYARNRKGPWVERCIRHAAHLTRFLVEDTPFDDPAVMRMEMQRIVDENGGDAGRIEQKRRRLLDNHRAARQQVFLAERDILQALDEHARCTLRTALVVRGCLRFIQFIATWEELKHILAVRTARALNALLKERRLDVADTSSEKLLAALPD